MLPDGDAQLSFCMCFYILPKLFFNFILFILLSYPKKRDGLSTVPAKIILSKHKILNLHVKGHLSFARPSPCLPETEKIAVSVCFYSNILCIVYPVCDIKYKQKIKQKQLMVQPYK